MAPDGVPMFQGMIPHPCVYEDGIHCTQSVVRKKEEREAASELGRESCVGEIWGE